MGMHVCIFFQSGQVTAHVVINYMQYFLDIYWVYNDLTSDSFP